MAHRRELTGLGEDSFECAEGGDEPTRGALVPCRAPGRSTFALAQDVDTAPRQPLAADRQSAPGEAQQWLDPAGAEGDAEARLDAHAGSCDRG